MQKQPSVIGGAAIIAGVCVGAGMLALPSAGAGAWTFWSSAVLILTMVVMTLSGAMLLEVYQRYDYRASFNTVTKDVLGNGANIFNNIAVYFVGAILLYAYITTLGGLFGEMLGLNHTLASVASCIVLGAFVWHSTRAVDRLSVVLILFMVLSFVLSISGLTVSIKLETLWDLTHTGSSRSQYVMMLFPVVLTSFGYHHSVTSMRAYYLEEKKAFSAIGWGTFIALSIYLLWIYTIFGNLPRANFASVIAKDGDIEVLLNALGNVIASGSIKKALDAFTVAAVVSSFVGVGLGLFDFIADFFGVENNRVGRSKTWLLCFVPPLAFSLLSPFGFVTAIAYAGAVAAIWTCITPALLVFKSRTLYPRNDGGFYCPGGKLAIWVVLIFGLLTAAFHLMAMADRLPVFKG